MIRKNREKQFFQKLVRQLHPDKQDARGHGPDEFILVKAARDALLDAQFKKAYNAHWRPRIGEMEKEKNEFMNRIACLKFRNRELQQIISSLKAEKAEVFEQNRSLKDDLQELEHLRRHNVEITRKMKKMEKDLRNFSLSKTQVESKNQKEIESHNEVWKVNNSFIIGVELPHFSKNVSS